MGDNSAIEWTDATWNPIAGCSKVSPGCKHCYAIRVASRFAAHPNAKVRAKFAGTVKDGNWTGVVNVAEHVLDQPIRWKRPRRIFVNSESDLFHEAVDNETIARIFAVMGAAAWHTFQVLTKRPARMRELLNDSGFKERVRLYLGQIVDEPIEYMLWPFRNVWLGVSVEDQAAADVRVPRLLEVPAAVRFLSCEPLLGAVELLQEGALFNYFENGFRRPVKGWPDERASHASGGLDWVITGGESGSNARPMHPAWVRSLRDQCVAAGVPFFFKQWGGVDKKSTGNTLDGSQWLQMPESEAPRG